MLFSVDALRYSDNGTEKLVKLGNALNLLGGTDLPG